MRPTALTLAALFAAACSAATPSQAPTASPSEAPTASPSAAPTSSPRPTPAPTFGAHAYLVVHPMDTVEGAPLGYIEYVPPGAFDATPSLAPPLLVFLHGSGESGDGDDSSLRRLYSTGLPRVLNNNGWPEAQPFVILMPQFGPDERHCTDATLIHEFLEFAIEHYAVDRERVYLTGLSCGAIGGWEYLGLHTDELVAAAVLIAGNGNYAIELAGCDLARVPIWAIHGGDDEAVDVSGSEEPIAALNDCTNPPPVDARINVYPGVGHVVWQPFYDGSQSDVDIYAWMLGYTNPL